MFGYVVIDKPNILIKDYQTYRSYYCGLCKAIGKRTGNLMRLTLNYDIVLLALLAYNYENKDPVFKKGRCPIHWIKKVEYVDDEEVFGKISDINTVLGYWKIVDDVLDEGKHKAIKAGLSGYYKKAAKRLPQFALGVKSGYETLRAGERDKKNAEYLAEVFGRMMMGAGEAVTDKCDAMLKKMLFYIGKWIYVIDALDDIKEDCEKGNFNPFLRNITTWNDTVWESAEKEARIILYDALDNIKTSYNAMRIGISEGSLSNIIYLGLQSRTEKILEGRGQKCRKIRL